LVCCELFIYLLIFCVLEDQTKTEDGKDLIDPEESEKALLHMPSLKTIMGGKWMYMMLGVLIQDSPKTGEKTGSQVSDTPQFSSFLIYHTKFWYLY